MNGCRALFVQGKVLETTAQPGDCADAVLELDVGGVWLKCSHH